MQYEHYLNEWAVKGCSEILCRDCAKVLWNVSELKNKVAQNGRTSKLFLDASSVPVVVGPLPGRREEVWHRWTNFRHHPGKPQRRTPQERFVSESRETRASVIVFCSFTVKQPDSSWTCVCVSVFDAYMKLSGYEMEESIKRETSGPLRDLLLAVGTRLHRPHNLWSDSVHSFLRGRDSEWHIFLSFVFSF